MQSTCLFCQIASGQSPAYVLYEDAEFMAFLDLYPYGPGHTLVIPKKHHRWGWEVPNFGEYMETAKKIAVHLAHKFQTDTIYSLQFGEQVPHAHIHLIPPLPEAQANLRQGFLNVRAPKMDDAAAQKLLEDLKFR